MNQRMRGTGPVYEEKEWEKDKVMTQARDKDRGGRLRPPGFEGCPAQGRNYARSLLFFFCPSLLLSVFSGISREVRGARSPVQKTRFFFLLIG